MLAATSLDKAPDSHSLDALDRIAVGYLVLPVMLFVAGWFRLWVSLPLLAGLLISGRCVFAARPMRPRYAVNRTQILLAVLLGLVWVYFSGIGHLVYANADWYTRDAVLHDLVTASWPVIYRLDDGMDLLLRAPLGFYMPAAVMGKLVGLRSAHVVLALWAAVGTVLFLLQAMSLAPQRFRQSLLVGLIVIFFSGLDFIGSALNWGPRFFTTYDIASHIEWWAGSYQYSAMTTQLFWVPNHALGAWVLMGLLARSPGVGDLDRLVPVLLVCAAVWSPLSALGILPFAGIRLLQPDWRARLARYLYPAALLPALLLVAVIGFYFTMDTGGINKGLTIDTRADGDVLLPLLSQFQFFLIEAGILGIVVLTIRRSADVITALMILLVLPLAQLGPGNDLVMRTSIPSLVVLMLACCAALLQPDPSRELVGRKRLLAGLLTLGAITAVHEFARAMLLEDWPINLHSTMIAVNCGPPPHYVARVQGQPIMRLMPPAQPLPVQYEGAQLCHNPALELRILRDQRRSHRKVS